jgi:hypothetical protein
MALHHLQEGELSWVRAHGIFVTGGCGSTLKRTNKKANRVNTDKKRNKTKNNSSSNMAAEAMECS